MDEESPIKLDVLKTRANALEGFKKNIEKSTAIWHSVLRLIITLSSSFLVITIAVVEKLFPSVKELPELLIVSWILLFISITFGIIAELNEAAFFANQATADANIIKALDKKISEGKYTYEGIATPYITYGTKIFGAISIHSFLNALSCLCLALLSKIKILNSTSIFTILGIGFIFFICMNIYLVRKLKKNS